MGGSPVPGLAPLLGPGDPSLTGAPGNAASPPRSAAGLASPQSSGTSAVEIKRS